MVILPLVVGIVEAGMSGPVSILSTYIVIGLRNLYLYYTDNIGIKQYITQIS